MATRTASTTRLGDNYEAILVTWQGLLNGDDGSPYQMLGRGDRCVQFLGTFGTGGTIVFEGSMDGTNYVTLTDPSSTAISKTAAAIEQILELTRYVRPRVTAGDGTTALECWLLLTR